MAEAGYVQEGAKAWWWCGDRFDGGPNPVSPRVATYLFIKIVDDTKVELIWPGTLASAYYTAFYSRLIPSGSAI
jgi:hypothetical protein